MRNLIFLLLIIGSMASCSMDGSTELENMSEISDEASKSQKWKLVEMSGNIANVPPSTGSEMAWQEYYILYPDSSFQKTRTEENGETQAKGTYDYITLADGKYLELNYEADHALIGNCTIEAQELLKVEADNRLKSTWNACDGPGLVYEKVE